MATAKKKPAAKKSTPAKVKAKVKAAVKPAPKKTVPMKASPAKSAKVNTKTTHVPSGREAKLAEQALKFVDEAASVLRTGIRSGAETSAKSRIEAKKKANALLGKASSNLSKAIGDGASALQSLLGKI